MTHPEIAVPLTVLDVEDEPLLRMDAVDMLEDYEFTVIEAAGADQAVTLLAGGSTVMVLLTDIFMPGSMDGLQLAHLVKGRWPEIAIVIVSGHQHIDADGLPAGAVFISKPYGPDALTRTVASLSSRH